MDEVLWNQTRYTEIKNFLVPFLVECGYNIEKEVTFVPIAGLLGDNLMEKS